MVRMTCTCRNAFPADGYKADLQLEEPFNHEDWGVKSRRTAMTQSLGLVLNPGTKPQKWNFRFAEVIHLVELNFHSQPITHNKNNKSVAKST